MQLQTPAASVKTCSLHNGGFLKSFLGAGVQYTDLGTTRMYDDGTTAVDVRVESCMYDACVTSVILQTAGDVLILSVNPGDPQVLADLNGTPISLDKTPKTVSTGFSATRIDLRDYMVAGPTNFELRLRLEVAYLNVRISADSSVCNAGAGLCGPCTPQSSSHCTDVSCLMSTQGILATAATHRNVSPIVDV